MKLKVIKVVQDGIVGYLKSTSIFEEDNVVENPVLAINYNDPCHAGNLEEDLENLHLPLDEVYAMSGVQVESAHVVELEVIINELSSYEGRAPHKR